MSGAWQIDIMNVVVATTCLIGLARTVLAFYLILLAAKALAFLEGE